MVLHGKLFYNTTPYVLSSRYVLITYMHFVWLFTFITLLYKEGLCTLSICYAYHVSTYLYVLIVFAWYYKAHVTVMHLKVNRCVQLKCTDACYVASHIKV